MILFNFFLQNLFKHNAGTINFSRIETAQLELNYDLPAGKKLPAGTWYVHARNFNELRIKGGMGGKRFAS